MNIVHDLIASVKGPGWRYGISRILIDDQDRGAVFVAGNDAPAALFTMTSHRTSGGTGETADGGEVAWRRRGSSCQYKLAKCKKSTAQMVEMWEAADEAGVQGDLFDETETETVEETEVKEPSKAELQEEARSMGLPVSGTKSELESRIAEAKEDLL